MPYFSRLQRCAILGLLLTAPCLAQTAAPAAAPTMAQLLTYPFVSGLVASKTGDRFAWVEDVNGVRNVWFALAAEATPHQLTHYTADNGQELTQLLFSADGGQLVYVRGGDHDENWPAEGNLAPNPDSSPAEPKVSLWAIATSGSNNTPVHLAEGDSPALSSTGQLAFVKDAQIWALPLPSGTTKPAPPQRLFFDRGKNQSPVWSPDGSRLAFVSGRGDHSFIAVYTNPTHPLVYLAPSTSLDQDPVWSPDGQAIAFLRQPGQGDAPENFLVQQSHPFALWTASVTTGEGRQVWSSPNTLAGSLPDLAEQEPLFWTAGNQLVFLSELDNWPHLYAIPATGGQAHLLTPGNFMVEEVSLTPDHRALVYSANTGHTPDAPLGNTLDDTDRRHLFRVRTDGSAPEPLTTGTSLEWSPAALGNGKVAYIAAGAQQPAQVGLLASPGKPALLDTGSAKDYPATDLVTPQLVSFHSPDGLTIQAQLFRKPGATTQQPGVIFVHGGPPRQMLLGWHYMNYYSNAYAVNQYLALHGFTVLSVNYRLGIGYGRAFQHPDHAGPAGASEYQDVLAGARSLQHVSGVDPSRIGIWGGSYGGYLTGLALARNSDVFKAGVDFHGIANWLPELAKEGALPEHWYDADATWKQATAVAFSASPDADIATWRSPVLLIQGDDDRNVLFDQTVELAHRLTQQNIPFEELVIPNEIHGFLRQSSWLHADEATARFLSTHLQK